jgi:Transposase DDE domain
LGKLTEPELSGLRGGWDDLAALLRGDSAARSPKTGELPGLGSGDGVALAATRIGTRARTRTGTGEVSVVSEVGVSGVGGEVGGVGSASRWEQADLRGLRVERTRDFGECYLALSLWHRLKLDELLASLLPAGRESVAWGHTAALLTVARFCAQRSELGVAEHWYETTALDDLLGVESGAINDDRLYRGLDQLGQHKDALCSHLMERYREWFGVRFEFLLYDVTSTYFEGEAAGNPQAQRGYSRDQRSGNKQVCIGLVCTPEGLPLSFEVFNGNRADVTTVEEIIRVMENKYGLAERVWVMDRGMVSAANIAFLRERRARYLVGTPKSWLRAHEQTLLEESDWKTVQDGLEVRLVAQPEGEAGERYVLCRSGARAQKERAMLARQSERLTEELMKVDRWLGRSPQSDLELVGRRIGRHLGKYPAAAAIVVADLIRDGEGRAVGVCVYSRLELGQRSHR